MMQKTKTKLCRKSILFFLFTLLLISSCSPSAVVPTIPVEVIQQTAIAKAFVALTQTQLALNPVTIQEPTSTPLPTPTTPPTETAGPLKDYSWNYLGSQDSGGVVITIGRVVVGEKTAIPVDFSLADIFDDRPVVAEIIFVIENKTAGMISVYPDQGKVMVGSEQIEIQKFMSAGYSIGDNQYSGDVLPGAKLIGGLWIGFQRTPLDQINSMTIFINAPYNQNYDTLGPDYTFNLDLSQKQFVEYPNEFP